MYTRCASAVLIATMALAAPVYADAPSTPTKEQVEQGRIHFQRGVSLYSEADFRAALIEFRKANEIAPNFRIQYNIGQACLDLQDYACALAAFQDYLTVGGKNVPFARRKEVEKNIARVSTLVAKAHIVVNKERAEITVDDVPVGTSPMADTIVIGAGRHRFSATLGALSSAPKVLDIASGDTVEVSLEIAEPVQAPVVENLSPTSPLPQPMQPGGNALPPRPQVEPPPSRTPVYIGLAATGVLTAGAVAFGIVSLSANNELDKRSNQFGIQQGDIDSARVNLKTMATVTNIFIGGAVVAGVITGVLYFSSSPKSDQRAWRVSPDGTVHF